MNSKDLHLHSIDDYRWYTGGLFNGNAFPKEVEHYVQSAWDRAATLKYHIDCLMNTKTMVYNGIAQLAKDHREFIKKHNQSKKDFELRLHYNDIRVQAEMTSVLFDLKSFLDVLSRLGSKLICNSQTVSFRSKEVNGKMIAGGALINWLHNNASSYKNSQTLYDLIEKNSDDWLLQAIKYRDDIAHKFSLSGMESAQAIASDFAKDSDDIPLHPPTMPDGQSVYAYARMIGKRLEEFTLTFISLLPNVNLSLLSQKNFILVNNSI